MAGEGFITHMITSLKANKRSRVSTFDKIKNHKKTKKSKLHFDKKASPLELTKIREKIQKENETNFKRKIIFLIILLIILLFLI
ncbi:MAG: hypothetical protein ABJH82_12030 [Polaribacter sp.]|uniref:hypothetical protein n=1 Tax=Polaribacter sp. TaxID=1920175 RepID=UPI0032662954